MPYFFAIDKAATADAMLLRMIQRTSLCCRDAAAGTPRRCRVYAHCHAAAADAAVI